MSLLHKQCSHYFGSRQSRHRSVHPKPALQHCSITFRKLELSGQAAEVQAPTESEPEVEVLGANESSPSPSSPLEKARTALAEENIDTTIVKSALDQLELEVRNLSQQATDAAARAEAAERAVLAGRDQLLRLNADFDNYRRRTADEKLSLADSVKGDVLKDLLPLLDNFELARTAVKTETEGEVKINNSYQGLYRQMVDIMRTIGLEAVPTEGTPFDPEIHEAIMQEPSEDVPDGTVLMEFRKGFRLNGKLLRPAMVKVSVADGPGMVASSEE